MKLIQKHLNNICSSLNEYYNLSSISNHSGNIGFSRELITKHFLCSNLPSNLDFTSGEIFDSDDERSGQIDIIIHPKSSIKLNIATGIDLVPIDSVLAAIECKSSLKAPQLKLALDSCVRVKRMNRINPIGIDDGYLTKNNIPKLATDLLEITGMLSAQNKTPYMIFSFKGPTEKTLRNNLLKYMENNNVSLDCMPNLITILDRNYYLVKNDGFFIKKIPGNIHWSAPPQQSTLLGMYMYLIKLAEAQSLSENFFPVHKYLV